MTKRKFYLPVLCAGLIMVSCGTGKNVVSTSSIDGEWNIVEVNGKMLELKSAPLPTIGFEEATHRIYGNSGCNRMMGSYQTDPSKPGSLVFGQMGSTRMACPDMSLEQSILNVLSKVRSYKMLSGKDHSSDKLALYDENGKQLAVIQKAPLDRTALNGEWKIVEVKDRKIEKSESEPFIGFDINEERLYGNAGCNSINGALERDSDDPYSLSFGQMITTSMACPDMAVEGAVLSALSQVKFFKFVNKKEVELSDKSGHLLIKLVKR